ncbi:uncharacterized protein V1510DRAFT_437359 [Dipodascopsis tothii]|uniref:uncharacterized protein n=1 Tax=Dipodascopsis tothii TaxID=44089 RepID=UPI0034CFDF4B
MDVPSSSPSVYPRVKTTYGRKRRPLSSPVRPSKRIGLSSSPAVAVPRSPRSPPLRSPESSPVRARLADLSPRRGNASPRPGDRSRAAARLRALAASPARPAGQENKENSGRRLARLAGTGKTQATASDPFASADGKPWAGSPGPTRKVQTHLSLTSASFKHTCPECGMSYHQLSEVDRGIHVKFHARALSGVEFDSASASDLPAVQTTDVRKQAAEGEVRIHKIGPGEPRAVRRAVDALLEICNTELSAPDDEHVWDAGRCVFVAAVSWQRAAAGARARRERRLVGLLAAERVQAGRFMRARSGELLEGDVPLVLGVSRLYVSHSCRRLGLATLLLDAARRNFVYGLEIERSLVGWSQPSASGCAVAVSWAGVREPAEPGAGAGAGAAAADAPDRDASVKVRVYISKARGEEGGEGGAAEAPAAEGGDKKAKKRERMSNVQFLPADYATAAGGSAGMYSKQSGSAGGGSGSSFLEASRSPPSKNLSHVPCKFFRQGTCQAGNTCPFSHSMDSQAEPAPCKYFQKGNCKFGPKCALAHIMPDGRRVNHRPGQGFVPLQIGGRNVPAEAPANNPSALARSLAGMMNNRGAAPAAPADEYPPLGAAISGPQPQRAVPTEAFEFASSPPLDGYLGARPLAMDASLPASIESNNLSFLARHGPIAASVPSKFGMDMSPSASTDSHAVRSLYMSAFGVESDQALSTSASSFKASRAPGELFGLHEGAPTSPPSASPFTHGLGNGTSTSSVFAAAMTTSASVGAVPSRRFTSGSFPARLAVWSASDALDNEVAIDDSDAFAYEEDFVPSSLNELLTPQERQRRGSRHDEFPDPVSRFSTTPSGVIGDAISSSPRHGSFSDSGMRFGQLFTRRPKDEPPADNVVGSPLRHSSLLQASTSPRSFSDAYGSHGFGALGLAAASPAPPARHVQRTSSSRRHEQAVIEEDETQFVMDDDPDHVFSARAALGRSASSSQASDVESTDAGAGGRRVPSSANTSVQDPTKQLPFDPVDTALLGKMQGLYFDGI